MSAGIMVQGTGSNVGKSLLVAGIARALTRRGLSVLPFKPQNMSNNAAVTVDGGEIGRAQALQAAACGADPVVDMNPVLLKPETETGSQVIVQGQRVATVRARDYAALKPKLLDRVMESYRRLSSRVDFVITEGAGSPAETNLRVGDIANMGFAERADLPVALVGCIDRGGVIAQLVGTHTVLSGADRARIRAFAVNKFRGDPALFDDGYAEIACRTGWQGLGVIPWFERAGDLPAEDAAELTAARAISRSEADGAGVCIACPVLSRIANFNDLDPLRQTPGVTVEMVPPGRAIPGHADVVILPGSKSTRGDLDFLRREGWDIDIAAHVRRGGAVFGICGGYQMLGRTVSDPEGIEGRPGKTPGLGLLDVETVMTGDKTLTRVAGKESDTGLPITGYEIHIGLTDGPDCARPPVMVSDRPHGAMSPDGLISGVYLHGIFDSDAFRNTWLARLGVPDSAFRYTASQQDVLDALANHVETHMDLDTLLSIARAG